MNSKKSVVIIEDDFILSELLKKRVNSLQGFHSDHGFENPDAFLKSGVPADIILLDIVMPGFNGIDAIEPIHKKYPETAIVMNSIKDDPETIYLAIKKGALGYIDKQTTDLNFEEVLNTVANGGGFMTPKVARKIFNFFQKPNPIFEKLTKRENDITTAILDGLSYKMIAERYGISIDTVRMNIRNIYRKLNVNSKGELFALTKNNA